MNEFKLEVKCVKDDDFNLERRVGYSCGSTFDVEKNEIFSAPAFDYFDEPIREYYAMCPICGRINKIMKSEIPDDIKEEIDYYCREEKFLYKKNNLVSEFIYLNMISPPIKRNNKPLTRIRMK